ncbi:hypothetical protein IJE86_03770 [bacterium]|nr:hypothetical protein [bacterium]
MKVTSILQFNTKIRTIDNKLLAGKKPTYSTLKQLKEQGVDTVIDLRSPNQWFGVFTEKLKCKLLRLNHIWHPIKLSKALPTRKEFEGLNNIIENTKKTFVHCRSGIHCTNLVCGASSILRGKKTVDRTVEDISQTGFFLTRKPVTNTEKRQRKLNRLASRLQEFTEMFENHQKP